MATSGKPLDVTARRRIVRLTEENMSRRKIARIVGVARRTVDKYSKLEK